MNTYGIGQSLNANFSQPCPIAPPESPKSHEQILRQNFDRLCVLQNRLKSLSDHISGNGSEPMGKDAPHLPLMALPHAIGDELAKLDDTITRLFMQLVG